MKSQVSQWRIPASGILLAMATSVLAGASVVVTDLPSHPSRTIFTFGTLIAGLLLLLLIKKPEWVTVLAVFLLPFSQATFSFKVIYVSFIGFAAVWLILNSKLRLERCREYYLAFAFLGCMIAIALAHPVLPVPFDSGTRAEEFVRHSSNLFLFVSVASLARKRLWLRRIVLSLFFSAVIVALLGILTVGRPVMLSSDQRLALRTEISQGRAFSTLGHPNINGQFSSLALLILLGAWTQVPRSRWRALFAVGLGVILVNLVLSGSRGALFGFGFGSLVLWLLAGRAGRQRAVVWIAVLLLFSLPLVIMAVLPPEWGKPISRLVLDPEDLVNQLTIRPQLWRVAWDAFLSSPLWGIGPLNLGYHFYHSSTALSSINVDYLELLQAHNMYLQFLSATGIIGTFVFLTVLVVYLRKGYAVSKLLPQSFARGVIIGATSAIVGIIAMGLVQTVLGKGWSTWHLFWIILGLIAGCNIKGFQQSDENNLDSSSG